MSAPQITLHDISASGADDIDAIVAAVRDGVAAAVADGTPTADAVRAEVSSRIADWSARSSRTALQQQAKADHP